MKIKLEGFGAPIDGVVEFDGQLTAAEVHEIKKITGLRPGEYVEAAVLGDPDIWIGYAVVGLAQNGVQVNPELLRQTRGGKIEPVPDEEAEEPDPPAKPEPVRRAGRGSRKSASSEPGEPS